jgi:hypothetical protein
MRTPRAPVAITEPAGYAHPAYARSLDEFGAPRALARSGGWLLERSIPGSSARDAMGPYPLFSCERWAELPADIDALEGGLVSVAAVLDPLAEYGRDLIRQAFPDVAAAFKKHWVVDLGTDLSAFVSAHHRRKAARALREIEVIEHEDPAPLLPAWLRLYGELVERRGLTGVRAFSPLSFARQLRLPGMVAFEARHDGVTVAIALWLRHGRHVYSHLTASARAGYAVSASYALYWRSLERLTEQGIEVVLLGGSAGIGSGVEDGLGYFKRGWATRAATALLCGRILDPDLYAHLAQRSPRQGPNYFPVYRQGELG